MPLSSYLIALAVGELESRELSSRCRVWAEASVVDLAASDFSQTEDFLKVRKASHFPNTIDAFKPKVYWLTFHCGIDGVVSVLVMGFVKC